MSRPNELISQLNMLPHPEGGYYKETYRSSELIINKHGKERNICTAIYFLLQDDNISRFHRIQSDELWFFHEGNPVEVLIIENNELKKITLGLNITKGENPQAIVSAGCWFASCVKDKKGYSLVSCTVSPGFDFEDFEMAAQNDLLEKHPELKETIIAFT